MESDNSQNLLNALFKSGLSNRDLGGLSLTRAVSYQFLYCLRIFEQIVRGEYSDYGTDVLEDYIVWNSPKAGEIDRVLVVQIKTAGNQCVLSQKKKIEDVLEGFESSARSLRGRELREARFRLVVNKHHGCESSCTAELELYREEWFNSRYRDLQLVLPGSIVKIEIEHFVSFAFTRAELMKRIEFLHQISEDFYQLIESEKGLDTMIQAIVGASLPLWHDRSRRMRQRELDDETLRFLFSNHRGREEVVKSIQAGFNEVASRLYENRRQTRFDAEAYRRASSSINSLFA